MTNNNQSSQGKTGNQSSAADSAKKDESKNPAAGSANEAGKSDTKSTDGKPSADKKSAA